MKRFSGGFWAVLIGALLPFAFPAAPWAGWPGMTAAGLVFPHGLQQVDSDLVLIGLYLLVIVVNGLAWGAVLYVLARVAFGRWFTERA
jgi:hypothetical protein